MLSAAEANGNSRMEKAVLDAEMGRKEALKTSGTHMAIRDESVVTSPPCGAS